LGNQVSGNGQIRFDTVYRFKGQEACAVIITDVPGDLGDLPPDSQVRRSLFTALTRATVRADIIYGPPHL
jgi:superfamily I DNA and RNA helicase